MVPFEHWYEMMIKLAEYAKLMQILVPRQHELDPIDHILIL